MNDSETLDDNYVGRRGKSTAGGMPGWALLSKWEQTGVFEDTNQMREYHRSQLKDFSCEQPWLESDAQVNGGIDPNTGQSRAGGRRSRGLLNLRFGGALNNTSPYLPDGTFLDYEFLENRDEYKSNGKKFEKNYTAGKAGVSRSGGPNWAEYNRQRNYRGKYVKYYNDGDYSTVEHGLNPVTAQENVRKAKFSGLKKLQRTGRTVDGRKPGKNPFFTREGEKLYHNIDQRHHEEKIGNNYKQHNTNAPTQDYTDHDQIINDGHYGKDNPTAGLYGDIEKAQRQTHASERIMQAFNDSGVKRSLAYILSTLNNAQSVNGTQRETEGFTNSQRRTGNNTFNGGSEIQMNAVESRAYEIARALGNEISNRKLGVQNYGNNGNIQMNTLIDTKIHEYMGIANRKLGPQEITLNLKESAIKTNLQPGGEVMDFTSSNKKSMADTDIYRSQLNAKIAHYRDDSRAAMNFSNIHPQISCTANMVDGEDYGLNSTNTINYKGTKPLYDGLKAAYFSEDMDFQEGAVDTARRSSAKGRGQARRSAKTTHDENDNDMNEVGHNQRNRR